MSIEFLIMNTCYVYSMFCGKAPKMLNQSPFHQQQFSPNLFASKLWPCVIRYVKRSFLYLLNKPFWSLVFGRINFENWGKILLLQQRRFLINFWSQLYDKTAYLFILRSVFSIEFKTKPIEKYNLHFPCFIDSNKWFIQLTKINAINLIMEVSINHHI